MRQLLGSRGQVLVSSVFELFSELFSDCYLSRLFSFSLFSFKGAQHDDRHQSDSIEHQP